jgi:hypothetical protein
MYMSYEISYLRLSVRQRMRILDTAVMARIVRVPCLNGRVFGCDYFWKAAEALPDPAIRYNLALAHLALLREQSESDDPTKLQPQQAVAALATVVAWRDCCFGSASALTWDAREAGSSRIRRVTPQLSELARTRMAPSP